MTFTIQITKKPLCLSSALPANFLDTAWVRVYFGAIYSWPCVGTVSGYWIKVIILYRIILHPIYGDNGCYIENMLHWSRLRGRSYVQRNGIQMPEHPGDGGRQEWGTYSTMELGQIAHLRGKFWFCFRIWLWRCNKQQVKAVAVCKQTV